MSRAYAAVFISILTRPKYRKLSPAGRGALLHLLALSGTQDPEATWDSRDDLLDSFELEGFDASHVDELIALRWLDLQADGSLITHNWDVWQIAASADIRRKYEASRKQEWRRTQKPLLPAPSSPERGGKDRLGKGSPGQVPDMSGTTNVSGDIHPSENDVSMSGGECPVIDPTALSGIVKPIVSPLPKPGKWAHWPSEALPFLQAWDRCGFGVDPTPNQMNSLWPIIRDHPNNIATWVDETSAANPGDVVADIFRRYKDFCAAQPPDPPSHDRSRPDA